MDQFYEFIKRKNHHGLLKFYESVHEDCRKRLNQGDGPCWKSALNKIPNLKKSNAEIYNGAISYKNDEMQPQQVTDIRESLKSLIPWRKGPFKINDIFIDTEWQSNLKWNRISEHLPDVSGASVIDIGCNNGYYMLRLLENQPELVLGVDPSILCYYQFQAIKKFLNADNIHLVPVGFEETIELKKTFDLTLNMGLLYHRRSPIDFLKQCLDLLKDDGTTIIETITIPGEEHIALVPEERYAKMRNIWYVPTIPTLLNWIRKAGYIDIKVVDSTPTTPEEQRNTEWVERESLEDFLAPKNPSKTVENYPAPIRTTVIAKKKPKQKWSF